MKTKENKEAVQLLLTDTVIFRSRLFLILKKVCSIKEDNPKTNKNLIILKLFQQNFLIRNFWSLTDREQFWMVFQSSCSAYTKVFTI